MLNVRRKNWMIMYLKLMRVFGVLPYTWEYKELSDITLTHANGIENIKLSCKLLIFSIIYHFFTIFIYVVHIEDHIKFYRDISVDKTSLTLQLVMYIYGIIFFIYYSILVTIMSRKSYKLLKILKKYDILFTYQWISQKLSVSFMISVVLFCIFSVMAFLNFIEFHSGIIRGLFLAILPLKTSMFSILFTFFFSLCSETVGNGWKIIVKDCKNISNNTAKPEEKDIKIIEQLQKNMFLLLQNAAKNASYLNHLQNKLNKVFCETISLFLFVTLCQSISTMFSLLSEDNNPFVIWGSISFLIVAKITIFICCNSSRTSDVQVINNTFSYVFRIICMYL